MSMLSLEINGQTVEVPEGSTIMDAACKLGVFVPHFCYHKKLSIAANCRLCLVDVEKAPKPLPACATPASSGMKVQTHSQRSIDAQKSVMEFLLINHPLDCPICDQGGECQLQDLAVGYGASCSAYQEEKRVVSNKDFGPLVSTEMTRCIHCTRCVRFCREIAGLPELGIIHRGEHAEITTFLAHAVSSEVSGNVIDLCPVGALTSKPFRYTARSWELSRRRSISPHDSLGSHLLVQVKLRRVYRVLPLENDSINHCWLSDRDRFSYLGLHVDRLDKPRVRRHGHWHTITWDDAFSELNDVLGRYRGSEIAGFAHPSSSLEELFLFQKFLRSCGSSSIESRINRFDDRVATNCPYLGGSIEDLLSAGHVFVVGSFIRHEQPLLAALLRCAVRDKKLTMSRLHVSLADDWLIPLSSDHLVSPTHLVSALASVLGCLARLKNVSYPDFLQPLVDSAGDFCAADAQRLAGLDSVFIVVGQYAQSHPDASLIHVLVAAIAKCLQARFGFWGEGANAVGTALVAATSPHTLFSQAAHHRLLFTMNLEFDRDFAEAERARDYYRLMDYVVCLSPFLAAGTGADLHLPIAAPYEIDATYVNMEGVSQSCYAAAHPDASLRAGWKVLRQMGFSRFGEAFAYDDLAAVRSDLSSVCSDQTLSNDPVVNTCDASHALLHDDPEGLACVAYRHAYCVDAVTRRAQPLQAVASLWRQEAARVSPRTAARFSLVSGQTYFLKQCGQSFSMTLLVDPRVLDGVIEFDADSLPSLYQTVYVENLCQS